MSWDGLIVGERWPRCGHPKTAANTYHGGHRQSPVCLECKRAYAREYAQGRVERNRERWEIELSQLPRDDGANNEFSRAIKRTATRLQRSLRR